MNRRARRAAAAAANNNTITPLPTFRDRSLETLDLANVILGKLTGDVTGSFKIIGEFQAERLRKSGEPDAEARAAAGMEAWQAEAVDLAAAIGELRARIATTMDWMRAQPGD